MRGFCGSLHAKVSALFALLGVALLFMPTAVANGHGRLPGTSTPRPDYELEKRIPPRVDVFNLNLSQTRRFSARRNFSVVGHSYVKGPWLTPFARENGLGAGFNGVRVYDGIAYLAGYNSPPTVFGVVIADVRNPKRIRPLSFIPCEPGTRCPYLRVNPEKKILVMGHDPNEANPTQPPAGQPVRAGFSFHDVSNPRRPRTLSFVETRSNGETHGFTIDGRYAYGCANTPASRAELRGGGQEMVVLDYADTSRARVVGSYHVQGQRVGEEFESSDRLNPDGSQQVIQCHEIVVHNDRAYVAWRDAGMVIVDVSDRTAPRLLSRLDYVPPFNGGRLGAAHTSAPVVTSADEEPKLLVHTDEIFECPPGFGRIINISTLANPQVLSSYRIPAINDNYNFVMDKFECPEGQQSIHLPWFDFRSPSLVHNTWYDQGVRTWDISNPFIPREVGYYISPRYAAPGRVDRHSREVYQDPATGLIYLTDGNGGGLTVLRWTGAIPPHPPIPGAR